MNHVYQIKYSRRAKYMRLTVRSADQVVLTVPFGMEVDRIHHFLQAKADWLTKAIDHMRRRGPSLGTGGSRAEYMLLKEQAREVITDRVRHFAVLYGLSYGRISIRNQKSCWGSCSKRGNFNFNYRLIKLAETLRDYVIVHELCHLLEFNHSPRFWAQVARFFPQYHSLRKQLGKYRLK